MPYVKNRTYCDIPFSNQTPHDDFYEFYNVQDLTSKVFHSGNIVVRCRTIGILQSIHGKFFLTDLDTPLGKLKPLVRVSMMFLKSPIESTVIPYSIQVFGTLQWKNRPVIYANVLQVLTIPMALRIRAALCSIVRSHRAKKPCNSNDEYTSDLST